MDTAAVSLARSSSRMQGDLFLGGGEGCDEARPALPEELAVDVADEDGQTANASLM